MGCSASKRATNGSNNNTPVNAKKIQVVDNKDESQNPPVKESSKDTQKEEKESSSNVANIESDKVAQSDLRTGNSVASSTVSFTKREETTDAAERDASSLHEALESSGSFKVTEAIKILAPVDYEYRQSVRTKFEEKFNENLVEKIVVNEERTLETALRNLVRSKSECLADYLHHSVKTNNIKTLVEILTAWSPEVIAQAKQIYEKDRRVSLKEDISNTFSEKMSEESRTILLSLSLLERDDESKPVDESISNEECDEMSQSGKAIIDVVTTKKHNLGQLSSIFHQFQAKYFLEIAESIEIEFQDETEIILKTIINIVKDTPGHFAQELNEMFCKSSVNKDRMAFILVTRQPVDLSHIVNEYEKLTNGSLTEAVNKNLKGNFRDLLKLIIERAKSS
ncbi:annexin A11-like [Rhopilema esculentum]|uniref:annexin A11-like n=1 Tax=Rhopilema esculentum TaxID=499914 RepID=UPI0031E082FD|eukprot:gene2841-1074_t